MHKFLFNKNKQKVLKYILYGKTFGGKWIIFMNNQNLIKPKSFMVKNCLTCVCGQVFLYLYNIFNATHISFFLLYLESIFTL